MKTILLLLMFIYSIPLHADGGQSGSGGNGCWIKDERTLMWISIEEMSFPELIIPGLRSNLKVSLPFSSSLNPLIINLREKIYGSSPFNRFERIKRTAPRTYRTLLSFSRLFEVSFVVNNTIEGKFDAYISRTNPGCLSYAPSLMTLPDGTIVFFKKAWDKMDSLSGEIILIHETIRLMQLFHPAFKRMTNKELQYLTSLFFTESTKPYLLNTEVKKWEAAISSSEELDGWVESFNEKRLEEEQVMESKKRIRALWN